MVFCAILSLITLSSQAVAEAPNINNPPNIKVYAFEKVLHKWGSDQWVHFDDIVDKESINWTVLDAHYPTGYTKDGIKSSAFGLCGFLDGTWEGTGYKKTEDPYIQISACVVYIQNRYGTPQKAIQFHNENEIHNPVVRYQLVPL